MARRLSQNAAFWTFLCGGFLIAAFGICLWGSSQGGRIAAQNGWHCVYDPSETLVGRSLQYLPHRVRMAFLNADLLPDGNVVRVEMKQRKVSREAIRTLTRFPGLCSVCLSGSDIDDDIASELLTLRHVPYFELASTRITDKTAMALNGLPSLEDVDLSATMVTALGVNELLQSGHVKNIRVSKCELRWKAIDWSTFSGVEFLDVSNSDFDDDALKQSSESAVSLNRLIAFGTRVSPTGIRQLAEKRRLLFLNIDRGLIEGSELEVLFPGCLLMLEDASVTRP